MVQSEKKLFQLVDPKLLADVLNTELKTDSRGKVLILPLKRSDDKINETYGHISFSSLIRNPEDFSVREASFLRQYGKNADNTFNNQDFILQDAVTVFKQDSVHLLINDFENRFENIPSNTWITLSKNGLKIESASEVEKLPPLFS